MMRDVYIPKSLLVMNFYFMCTNKSQLYFCEQFFIAKFYLVTFKLMG